MDDFRIKVRYLFDEASAKAETKKARGLFGDVVKDFRSQLGLQLGRGIAQATIRGVKDMVDNVKELDKAQTELKKVTELSGKSLDTFTNKAYEAGKKTARTGTEMVQASTEFAKMGIPEDQLLSYAEAATMFQNIADSEVSAGDAASFIYSQMKAFSEQGLEAADVIDKINNVSNNFGVSSTDLSQALTKTAGAMSTYGNSIEGTMALVTAGVEVMPKQASKVARGWRTIGANIVKLAGDTDTLSSANGKVSVALKKSNGEMRSTYDIMKDLYPQWKNLNKEEKSNLALSLAGKSHMEVFSATMNNFGTVSKNGLSVYETAMRSAGSATEENEKYLDSIEGKMSQLQSAWEQLSYHVVNSELIKNGVDFLTSIVKAVDFLVQHIGALPTVLLAVGAASKGLSALEIFSNMAEGLAGRGGLFGLLTMGVSDFKKASDSTGKAIAKSTKKASVEIGGRGGFVGQLIKAGKEYRNLKNNSDVLTTAALDARKKHAEVTKEEIMNARKLLDVDKKGATEQLKKLDNYKALGKNLKDVAITGAKVGLVIGTVVAAYKVGEYFSFDKSIERAHEYEKQLISVKSEIEALHQKEKEGGLTEKEKTHLKVLEAEERSLERQIQLEQDRARKGFEKEVTSDAGLAGESGGSIQEVSNYEKSLKKAEQAYDDLQYAIKNGTDKDIAKAEEKYNKFVAELAEDTATVAEKWEQVSSEIGDDYDKLSPRAKKAYDDLHKAFLQSTNDSEDVSVAIGKIWDSLDEEGRTQFAKIDFSQFKTVEELLDSLKEKGVIPMDFELENYDETAEKKDEITEEASPWIKFLHNLKEVQSKKDTVSKDTTTKMNFVATGLTDIGNTVAQIARDAVKAGGGQHATGKRKGEHGGLAWLGDEGSAQNPRPELVVGEHGAYLAGTQGWEQYPLKSSDTVYTYAQTKKLLGGSQKFSPAGEIPRFAKGKNSKARKAFDNALATLEYKRNIYHWTDKYFQEQYNKLFNKYKKKLSLEQRRDYYRSRADYRHERDVSDIESSIDVVAEAGTIDKTLKAIADARKARNISADEAKKMRAEAYHNNLIYARKEFEAGKVSYNDLLKIAKNYWKEVGTDSKEYYESLDELREASRQDLENQQKRHDDEMDYMKQYIQLQISSLESQKKMNDREKQSVEDAEELVELQNNLAQARSTMVKVWREGVGWVYEQDTKAIKEAQKALDDFNEAHETDSIDEMIQRYQDVLDLFGTLGEEADLIKLGEKLGISGWQDLIKGSILDIDYMSEWIKSEYAWINALDDLGQQLENMTAKDYAKYKETGITSEMLAEKIAQYGYDPSLLYARPELRGVIGGGGFGYNSPIVDAYIPEVISRIAELASDTFSQIVNIQHLELPNVENATDFARELQGISNKAIQFTASR